MNILKNIFSKKKPVSSSNNIKNSNVEKKKSNTNVLDNLDFVKVDLSFIPTDLIPQKLLETSREKLLTTKNDEDYLQIFLNQKVPMNKIASLISDTTKFKMNFWTFEREFQNFIIGQLEKKNYQLAEKCANYLLKIGSSSIKTFELIIQTYFLNDNDDGKLLIKNLIIEELSKEKTFLPRNQMNKLLFHSINRLFSNDEIWKLFNKELMEIDSFDEHSVIYEVMGDIILSEGKYLDALYKYILSYCKQTQYLYFLDTSLNSNNFEKYKSNSVIRSHLRKFIKKTNFEKKEKEVISLVETYLINLPKLDLISLGGELKDLLSTK